MGYRETTKDKYKIHLLKFDYVDTTMRIAEEFRNTISYIKGVNDQEP
jgi:hypothetical protein